LISRRSKNTRKKKGKKTLESGMLWFIFKTWSGHIKSNQNFLRPQMLEARGGKTELGEGYSHGNLANWTARETV